jgi:hypothetical protein
MLLLLVYVIECSYMPLGRQAKLSRPPTQTQQNRETYLPAPRDALPRDVNNQFTLIPPPRRICATAYAHASTTVATNSLFLISRPAAASSGRGKRVILGLATDCCGQNHNNDNSNNEDVPPNVSHQQEWLVVATTT